MFNLQQFIADHVICRPTSMFAADIEANKETLQAEIRNKSVCVIGGAGSIGSSFIKAVLPFKPSKLIVIDLNENGLAELTRDLRSTYGMYVPAEYRAYTLNFADPIFERIFREEKGFDIVANFSAHKHVRSEKDKYSVQALIENNDIKAKRFLDLLAVYPPRHFFCVIILCFWYLYKWLPGRRSVVPLSCLHQILPYLSPYQGENSILCKIVRK